MYDQSSDQKIGDLEAKIQAALRSLRATRDLPPALQPLRYLAPEGVAPKVSLGRLNPDRKFRDIRDDASARTYWDPSSCQALISFEPEVTTDSVLGQPPSSPDARVQDLLEALERAEREPGLRFVALTWFRDKFLPRQGYSWAEDPSVRDRVLREATNPQLGLVLRAQVPNPKAPTHPTTTIRLNRSHPHFRAAGSQEPQQEPPAGPFRPRRIKGAPLSQTVLEGRR